MPNEIAGKVNVFMQYDGTISDKESVEPDPKKER